MNHQSQTNPIGQWTVRWLRSQKVPVNYLKRTVSTSDLAKQEAFTSPPLMVYVAEEQTSGRGRGSNSWQNPTAGSALLATWSLSVQSPPQHLTAPLTGLNVYRALRFIWPKLAWSLKPPNDIYLENFKAGGLLVESLSRGGEHRLLFGFGLNVQGVPPGVDIAGFIESQSEPVTEPVWQGFLQRLHRGFLETAKDSALALLPRELCEEISSAVRQYPGLSTAFKEVTPQGDIVYQDHRVSWRDL